MDKDARLEQRAERLDALTRTGRDSDMGKLLRRFWQPVATSRGLAQGKAQFLRILSEDLTLYRGASGRAYLVAARCAHRLTLLHTGWVEGEEIRCIYHGWKYDGTGQCVERPAEEDEGIPKVRIASYPVHEYAGLVFAYMGDGPAPAFELPRKPAFERQGGHVFAKKQIWPCNWLQQVENSLDAVHVSFVHQAGRAGTFGQAVSRTIPKLAYEETDAGIRQIATRSNTNVRISDWTFPNNNHISVPGFRQGDPWIDVGAWMVPVDDEHTARFTLWGAPSGGPDFDRRLTDYAERMGDYNPSVDHDALFNGIYPDDTTFALTNAQDYVAQMGQGIVADREHEYLGTSDAGIVFLRRLYLREIEAIRAGRPTKTWRPLPHAAELPIQVA
ncbi:MAG TPA: Rieske 2Fe-2S domain-containing protein [Stellaceae bacterium]|nr:Rieske 2Fe-2S domain-containing protein [Stellaceae bacterium]